MLFPRRSALRLSEKVTALVVAGGFVIATDQELDLANDISAFAQFGGKKSHLRPDRDYAVRKCNSLVFVEIRKLKPDREEEQEFCLAVTGCEPIACRFGPNRYTGMVEKIGAGRIRGWAQRLFAAQAAVRLRVLVDSQDTGEAIADSYRSDLAAFSYRGGYDGFDIPIPEVCYDGHEHRIEIGIDAKDQQTILSVMPTWRFRYRKSLDVASGGRLAGWVFDPAASDSPIELSLVTDTGVIRSWPTFHRADVAQSFGARVAGFDFTLDGIEGKFWVSDASSKATPLFGPFFRYHAADVVAEIRADAAVRKLNVRSRSPELSRATAIELNKIRVAARDEPWVTVEMPPVRVGSAHVCVIIPVYKGMADTVACIESVLASTLPSGTRVIVINDCSPEEDLTSWLEARASAGQFELIENHATRGFVASVNAALARCNFQNEDVILLNSDTLVPANWIERLRAAAYSGDNVASVTPFSNNATICSFPVSCDVNELPNGIPATQIDAMFKGVNSGATVTLPTGVGFCMYLRGDALEEVGPLDERWGQGYGEENHWCMMASDLGWKHLLACDLFVFHKGSVSFGKTRELLMQLNGTRLQELYPEYAETVSRHIHSDPAKRYRANVMACILKTLDRPLVIHVAHERGGGLERHVRDLMQFEFERGLAPLLLSADGSELPAERLRLSNLALGISVTFTPTEMLGFLCNLSQGGQVLRCHFHFLPIVDTDCVEKLRAISQQIVVTVHDFHAVCPRLHLLDSSGNYCGMPSITDCQRCISSGQPQDILGLKLSSDFDISKWLSVHRSALMTADLVVAPSIFAADTIRRRFELSNVRVIPHPETEPRSDVVRSRRRFGEVVIAILGGIGPEKGFSRLSLMVGDSGQRRLGLRFAIIGYTSNDAELLRFEKVSISGPYNRSDLPTLLEQVAPDLVFLPSIVGETYSFTLSEAISEGLPVVCFDIGAQAERLRSYGYPGVIPTTWSPGEINDHLLELAVGFREGRYTERPAGTLSFQEYYRILEEGICSPQAVRPQQSARPGSSRRRAKNVRPSAKELMSQSMAAD
jgi:O-antigen biosynthesis protein